jgi:hypothetical protein
MNLGDREMYVEDMDCDAKYLLWNSQNPHLIKQSEFIDLMRDLNVCKNQAERLGSKLRGWNLLKITRIGPFFVTVKKNLQVYFPRMVILHPYW